MNLFFAQQSILQQVTVAWKDQITTLRYPFSFPTKWNLSTKALHYLGIKEIALLGQALNSLIALIVWYLRVKIVKERMSNVPTEM